MNNRYYCSEFFPVGETEHMNSVSLGCIELNLSILSVFSHFTEEVYEAHQIPSLLLKKDE